MAKGGQRVGSGRKPGVSSKLPKNLAMFEAEKAKHPELFDEDIKDMMPLSVMLRCMRIAVKAGDDRAAFERAAACAPFFHPKLALTESKITIEDITEASTIEQRASNVFGKSAPAIGSPPGSDAIN